MLNKNVLTAAITATLLSGAGIAQAQQVQEAVVTGDSFVEGFEISANVALTSDYRFRGISQTGEDAAIQGGFDAEFGPGFYIGTWASSVDFGDVDDGSGSYGTMEIDYYAGWSSSIGDTDFGVDVGYMYYSYPGDTVDPEGDYQEFYLKGSWKDLTVGATYSDDYYAETGEFWYFAGDYSYSFLEDFSLGLHVGYNDFDEVGFFATGQDSYTDYSVSLSYSVWGVDLSAAFVGTDLDEEDCWDTDFCEDTAVFSISKSL